MKGEIRGLLVFALAEPGLLLCRQLMSLLSRDDRAPQLVDFLILTKDLKAFLKMNLDLVIRRPAQLLGTCAEKVWLRWRLRGLEGVGRPDF